MTVYTIIGNGVAGTTAAQEIRRIDDASPIMVLTEEDLPFYYRIRLPEVVAGDVDEVALVAHEEDWYWDHGIDLYLNSKVIQADPNQQLLWTEDGREFPYDRLLLANGSHSFVPPIEGADLSGVFTLRSIQDARRIKAWAESCRQTTLIGGGLLGLEAGNGLRKLGKQVNVVEFFPRLLPRQLDVAGAARLQSMLEEMGFRFYLGAKTKALSGPSQVGEVHLEDGQNLDTEMVMISAGVRPNLELGRQLGVDVEKGILVDEHLQTSLPSVFAAGDAAECQGRLYGIWPAAMEQGRMAGRNMTGNKDAYRGTVMANTLKVVGIDLASAGEIDAEDELDSRVRNTDETYRKVVLDDGRIIGCIMLGDTAGFQRVTRMMKDGAEVSSKQVEDILAGA